MSGKLGCEICGQAVDSVERFDFGTRLIALCKAHAGRAKRAAARTPEALRELFVEGEGRRALLSRRAPEERRLFPPRPEGRRCDDGRRGNDPR